MGILTTYTLKITPNSVFITADREDEEERERGKSRREEEQRVRERT